jgi:Cu+-exporting ATPase
VAVKTAEGHTEAEVLRLTASVERASEHPLADAIVNEAKERGIQITDVQDFDSPVGKSVLGTVDGKKVLLGKATFLRSQGIDTSAMEAEAERQRGEGAPSSTWPSTASSRPTA